MGNGKKSLFNRLAGTVAHAAGRPVTFLSAVLIIFLWGISGPLFGYSDTWQLVINTGTTIITFLMVFLIQNTQNRDTSAIQIKLDELIIAVNKAHNDIIDVEDLDDDELKKMHDKMVAVANKARSEKLSEEDENDPQPGDA
jgi:low affinity Fe/Cu permease